MFTRMTPEIIDAKSGLDRYFGDNEQQFDVKIKTGEMYTFATNIRIGIMSDIDDIFAHCENPEDIVKELREVFRTGDYMIEVAVCERPMDA